MDTGTPGHRDTAASRASTSSPPQRCAQVPRPPADYHAMNRLLIIAAFLAIVLLSRYVYLLDASLSGF